VPVLAAQAVLLWWGTGAGCIDCTSVVGHRCAIKKQLKPKKAAERDLITPKIISELICKLFTGITKLGYLKKKMEKVYCYNDTHAWERPHKSLIVQDNKFIIVPVHVI